MKKTTGIAIAAIVAVLAIGVWAWRAGKARKAAPATVQVEAVVELARSDVVDAQTNALNQGVLLTGSLRAVHSAVVKARVAGELQGLAVREGDAVRAGQVIATIDPAEHQARLRQAQQQADAARSQVEIAKRNFDNNQAMVDKGFISRTALESSQSSLTGAQATYQAAVAAVDVANKTLDDTALRAPITGVVSQRLAQPGERLAIDGRVIEIIDPTRLELEATLAPADSVHVRTGQTARLNVEGAAQPVTATVVRINPSAQAGSRGVPVYLSVPATPGLRQGLFAQGMLVTERVQALAVPLGAVRTDRPTPYVQVIEGERVRHKAVQPGARGEAGDETLVAVTGLQAGARVILGHVGALREGTAVRFTAIAAPPASAPTAGTAR